jgi:hypothetical protein
VRRVAGWLPPLLLALAGAALIVAGQLDLDDPVETLPPIPDPTVTEVARPSATATPSGTAPPTGEATGDATPTASPSPPSTPTPIPDDVIATQLEVPAVGVNVAVKVSSSQETCDFPPSDAAYIICGGAQPGRGTNSYIFAHALTTLFKPLWNVQLGAEVKILLSDGTVLRYIVTEVRPNVPCPDDSADPHPNPPLALIYAGDDCEEGTFWTAPTDHERVTLQTSQGFNRNWGELVIVAKPLDG